MTRRKSAQTRIAEALERLAKAAEKQATQPQQLPPAVQQPIYAPYVAPVPAIATSRCPYCGAAIYGGYYAHTCITWQYGAGLNNNAAGSDSMSGITFTNCKFTNVGES